MKCCHVLRFFSWSVAVGGVSLCQQPLLHFTNDSCKPPLSTSWLKPWHDCLCCLCTLSNLFLLLRVFWKLTSIMVGHWLYCWLSDNRCQGKNGNRRKPEKKHFPSEALEKCRRVFPHIVQQQSVQCCLGNSTEVSSGKKLPSYQNIGGACVDECVANPGLEFQYIESSLWAA